MIFLVIGLAACGSGTSDPPLEPAGQPSTEREHGSGDVTPSTDLASDYEFEPYPGSTWYGPGGEEIPEESNIINAITGPEHCEWQEGVMMHVGWPPGHDAADASESRQYFRDPKKVFPQFSLMTTYDGDVELPKGAEYTGYRTDFMELWLDEKDKAAAYLVFSDHVERWPRAKEIIACA